jgi:uncharacterized protein
MTVEELKNKGLIIFECISGSKAYGLDTPQSDTDIKGVFVLPENDLFGLHYLPQVNNETNDIVYYELGRFVELLLKNNPNILEMLCTPADSILYRHKVMNILDPELFISKLCMNTFGMYAWSQVKKARGLNKKIVNPVEKKRKSVLDFCFVLKDNGVIPLINFLEKNNLRQEFCGLTAIPHMVQMYALYYSENGEYKGIVQKETANEVSLSSVPEGEVPVTYLSFNKDGYSQYCNAYREYQEWIEKRNENRFENSIALGRNYDTKNMMHVFRLLAMAEEIGKYGKVKVRRDDREYLLKIKHGDFSYVELVESAEKRMNGLKEIYSQSGLQEMPDLIAGNELLVRMRKILYKE